MKKQVKKLKTSVILTNNSGEKRKVMMKIKKKDIEQIADELRKWLIGNYTLSYGELGMVIYHLRDDFEMGRVIHFIKKYISDKK